MSDYRYWAAWARQRANEFAMYRLCTRDKARLEAVIQMHLDWAAEYDQLAAVQEARFYA